MKLGYNTNGFCNHRIEDAIEILAEIGYRSIAITVDYHCLNPYAENFKRQLETVQKLLQKYELSSVIETGARFLLNRTRKHEPTLMSADAAARAKRIDFLKRCIDIAACLGSDVVSFWSGILRDDVDRSVAIHRLTEGCQRVIDYAEQKNVTLGFEPEPGMFIDTFAGFEELLENVESPHFGLTVDIGHVHCLEDEPIGDYLKQWASRIVNIHIEDMKKGIHEHLMFGAGEIDFSEVIKSVEEIGYRGGVHVELSRHSHIAPTAARDSFEFLTEIGSQHKS